MKNIELEEERMALVNCDLRSDAVYFVIYYLFHLIHEIPHPPNCDLFFIFLINFSH